jgi:SAM-dependent methyltransferase
VTTDGIPRGDRPPGETAWDGDAYQRRFDALAASGVDVHGEVDLLVTFTPLTVLDAGCGTGRVATELTRRGVGAVGIDRDPSMIDAARRLAPGVRFEVLDVTEADLGDRFELVVMAGNVPLFTPGGTQDALVSGCARHLVPGGRLVAGFQLGRGYTLRDYDAACDAVGLALEDRWSTWDRAPFADGDDYAVSVHRSA